MAIQVLHRPQFSVLQANLFPIYFSLQSVLPVVLAFTYPAAPGGSSGFSGVLASSNRLSTLTPLSLMLISGLSNLLVVGPATTKCMRDRRNQGTCSFFVLSPSLLSLLLLSLPVLFPLLLLSPFLPCQFFYKKKSGCGSGKFLFFLLFYCFIYFFLLIPTLRAYRAKGRKEELGPAPALAGDAGVEQEVRHAPRNLDSDQPRCLRRLCRIRLYSRVSDPLKIVLMAACYLLSSNPSLLLLLLTV